MYRRARVAQDRLDGAEGCRTDLYGEYGLTPTLSVTAKSERVSFRGGADFNREWCRLTLRRELFSRGGWVAGAGLETRLGAGWSGVSERGLGRHAFADIARIVQQDGCERSRIEIGHGQDITECILISQQFWLEDGDRSVRSLKADAQLGVRVSGKEVSLGCREELGGLYKERAVLAAVVSRR